MRRPPLVKGLPILGNLLALQAKPLMFLLNAYHEHGKLFRLRVMGREMLVLAGIEANRLLMRTGAEFTKGGIYHGFNEELGEDAHFSTVDGEAHALLRHTAKAGYSRSRLHTYEPEIIACIRRHLQDWSKQPSVELMTACEALALDIVGIAITHYDASVYSQDIQTFVKWLHLVYPMKAVPKIALKLPFYQKAKRRVFEMAEGILTKHPSKERDLINDLLESPLERHQIIGQTISPYFVGIDTIASSFSFLIYLLLKNPESLSSIQYEVLRGEDKLLKGAIRETIRLYPIAPILVRRTEIDFEFAGYSIQRGTELVFATAVCHYLPEFFPEPHRFRPERPAAQAGAFGAWGLGVHTCLGAGMAEHLLVLMSRILLTEAKISLLTDNYQLKQKLAPIPSPDGLRIRVQGILQP